MKLRVMMLAATLVAFIVGPTGSVGAQILPAPDVTSVLILEETVVGGAASLEALEATIAGFTPVVAPGAIWITMSSADFASYRAIVLGDPNCSGDSVDLAGAELSKNTWGPEIDGNVVILGTDPEFHSYAEGRPGQGGDKVTRLGIAYAADIPGSTGAYITLSCYFFGTTDAPVPVLDPFGVFTVNLRGTNGVTIVAAAGEHAPLNGLVDADIES